MNLTDKQALLLSQLGYMNLHSSSLLAMEIYHDQSLKEITNTLIQIYKGKAKGYDSIESANGSEGQSSDDYLKILTEIGADSVLGNLQLSEYKNNNATTGFVAYAFKDPRNNASVFSFRGSEGTPMKTIDWTDNVNLGVNLDSIQFPEVQKFVADNLLKNKSAELFVTGHSKGGANAMYAAASFENCMGKTFNGPGVGFALDSDQKERLIESKLVNYVSENDFVGSLMGHPEKRVFVEQMV